MKINTLRKELHPAIVNNNPPNSYALRRTKKELNEIIKKMRETTILIS
jgi:hypothetical protein